jgi:membrane protease YdiL (CAAX protease family)
MPILDHALVILIAIVHPVVGYVSFTRLLRRAAAGIKIDRVRLYTGTIVSQWTLLALLLANWLSAGRPLSGLGTGLALDAGFAVALALTFGGVVLLLRQLRTVQTADREALGGFRSQLGPLEIILPAKESELQRFTWLALTAGIVEETLWRGYLFWYLLHYMPLWSAALVSTLAFGMAHAYQGIGNVPKIIAVGAVFAILYMLSGSIWLPILLHALVDLIQGRLAYEIVAGTGKPTPSVQ